MKTLTAKIVYSYTIVVNNMYPYLLFVIPLLYTTVGRHYPRISLLNFWLAHNLSGAGHLTMLTGFLYNIQLFDSNMHF